MTTGAPSKRLLSCAPHASSWSVVQPLTAPSTPPEDMSRRPWQRSPEHAASHGVGLAVEPLHPMYCADRSVIVTLDQAQTVARSAGPPGRVGVVVDAYHVWWDPDLYQNLALCAGRILGFHVSDWLVPTPDILNGRGLMGDGIIELRRLRRAVDATGYGGPIEVEIFNRALWALPAEEALNLVAARYLTHVADEEVSS